MYCTNCGKELPSDANFCSYCGTSIKENENQTDEQLSYYSKIIPFVYDEVDNLSYTYLKVKMNGKLGIMNNDATVVIPCVYEEIKPYYNQNNGKNELSYALVRHNGKWGIYCSGKEIISCIYNSIDTICADSIKYFRVELNDKFGIFDMNGGKIMSCIYDKFEVWFSLIFVQINGRLGIYSSNFIKLMPCQYDKFDIECGRIYTYKDNYKHKGLIKIVGTSIIEYIPCEYDEITRVKDDIYLLRKDIRYGIAYNRVIFFPYDKIEDIGQERYVIRRNSKSGIFYQGHFIIPCDYDSIEFVEQDFIKAQKGQLYDIYDYESLEKLLSDIESMNVIKLDFNPVLRGKVNEEFLNKIYIDGETQKKCPWDTYTRQEKRWFIKETLVGYDWYSRAPYKLPFTLDMLKKSITMDNIKKFLIKTVYDVKCDGKFKLYDDCMFEISILYDYEEILPIISPNWPNLYSNGKFFPLYHFYKYRKGNKWGSIIVRTKECCFETVPCLYDDIILCANRNLYLVKKENKFGIYKHKHNKNISDGIYNPEATREVDGNEIYSCIYDNITYSYSDMTFVLLKDGEEHQVNIMDV